jgi:tetratricopeptide (TPR) repeat protein
VGVVVYGIYGLLLLSGLVTILIVAQGRLSQASSKEKSQIVLPYFIFAVVLLLTLVRAFPGLLERMPVLIFVFGAVVIGLVVLVISMMVKTELERASKEKKTAEALVDKYLEALRKNPQDFGSRAGLARAYGKSGKFAQAAEEYGNAALMCSEEARSYRQRLEDAAETMKKLSLADEAKRTFQCPSCGARNVPLERLCSDCGRPLYGSTLRWAWLNTGKQSRIAAVVVIAVSLLFLLRLPVTYVLTLMAVWLAVVVYFSMPWEKFSQI